MITAAVALGALVCGVLGFLFAYLFRYLFRQIAELRTADANAWIVIETSEKLMARRVEVLESSVVSAAGNLRDTVASLSAQLEELQSGPVKEKAEPVRAFRTASEFRKYLEAGVSQ